MTLPGSAGPLPHHDGSALHAPRHVELGAEVRLRLRVPAVWGRPARVWLRSIHDGEPRYDPARNLGARPTAGSGGKLPWRSPTRWPATGSCSRPGSGTGASTRRGSSAGTCPTTPTSASRRSGPPRRGCAGERCTRSSRTASPARLLPPKVGPPRTRPPDWAVPCRLGHHRGGRLRPADPVPVLRRRPPRHHRAAGPHPGARSRRHLPDAVLPGPLQPPLRRRHLHAAWIRCWAGTRPSWNSSKPPTPAACG